MVSRIVSIFFVVLLFLLAAAAQEPPAEAWPGGMTISSAPTRASASLGAQSRVPGSVQDHHLDGQPAQPWAETSDAPDWASAQAQPVPAPASMAARAARSTAAVSATAPDTPRRPPRA